MTILCGTVMPSVLTGVMVSFIHLQALASQVNGEEFSII